MVGLESEILVATEDERLHLAIGDGALEHPKATVGVHPAHTTFADFLFDRFDARGNFIGSLDVVYLDVDDADAEGDFLVDLLERVEVALGAMGHFKHEVIAVQGVEELDEFLPIARLDRLATVVAEAEVDRALGALVDFVEDDIHGRGGEGSIIGIAGDVGLINLHASRRQSGHLIRQHSGQGHGEVGKITVMMIEERAGQHVGTGGGEFEGATGNRSSHLAVMEEVEGTFPEFIDHDTGGLAPETHGRMARKFLGDGATNHGRNAGHGADEILDHAVGVGVIDIETRQLAIGRQIDAGLALDIKNHPGGIDDALFAR